MSRYRFELATPADDADLRRILSETPMEGRIAVSFRREPSYFDAAVVEGDFRQVVAARDCVSGKLVGFGGRSVRLRYVNGRPERIGYLGSLRLLTGHRNRGLVARGYKFLRELHGDQRSSLYLTTIAAGNDAVIRLLTSGRAGLPAYHYIGDYCTLAIPLARRRFQGVVPSGLTIRPATSDDLATILTFLATQGPRRQFFPCYAAQDFFTPAGALRDLRPADLLLAFRDEQLIGTLAAWDQHGFRQNVIHGYSGLMRWSRPFYNAWARLRGLPGLPLSCAPFRHLTGALPVVMDEDPAVFHALLDAIVQHLADSDAKYMLLGLHESDPLVSCAQAHCANCYTTQMYLVCWDDGESLRSRLDCRVPYLELGSL
jgi:hypothetical protein